MIDFQLVVQHRAAGVLTSTNFNLDALDSQLLWEDWGKEKVTARKNKRGKLTFNLTVPQYLFPRTLKLEAEVPANKQVNAPKEHPTPVVC
jgi:hypothetical protein